MPYARFVPGLPALAILLATAAPAMAEPLPVPSADFALTAKLRDGGALNLAHAGGKMRLEMTPKAAQGTLVGILDIKAGKMVVMVPAMPKMAVEMELPADYSFASLTGNGTRIGTSSVAGEACDLWQVAPSTVNMAAGPSTACITADGIALRTEMEIQGKPQLVYEVTSLTRGPQDAHLFALPAGVQIMHVPKAAASALPGFAPAPAAPAPSAQPPAPPAR